MFTELDYVVCCKQVGGVLYPNLSRNKDAHGIEQVIFMNMCMVYDDAGNVLALDKINDSYTGTTFPGEHVETGETFTALFLSLIIL